MKNALAFLLLSTVASVANAAEWTATEPPPEWVSEEAFAPSGQVSVTPDRGDSRWLLVENQMRVGRREDQWFSRLAQQVVTTTGISEVSKLTFDFDPSFQRLQIHSIWVHRDGKKIDALVPSELKVIQPERDLDRRIYDGSLQVLALLPDIRVGDVVEWSSTVSGRNPALGAHHADWWSLGWRAPIERFRLLILARKEHELFFKHFNTELRPTTSARGEWTEHRWARDDLPGVVWEDGTPSWSVTGPTLQVTDFTSWAEVAAWAESIYRPRVLSRERIPAALAREIEGWERLGSEEERARAAVRFVQDEVRYLGIEIGPSGLVPHDPALVFERRFGDCKDKALLLVSILKAMSIQAEVALVHTDWKQSLDGMLPSPFVFDHVITAVDLGTDRFWVDATRSLQRGPLPARPRSGFRRALIVSNRTDELSRFEPSTPTVPQREILEEYTREPDGSTTLRVTTVTRGDAAESTRYSFATNSREDIARSYLNFYADTNPNIVAASPLAVEDDEATNTVVVVERYRLPEFWKGGARDFYAWSIDQELANPSVRLRTRSLEIKHPRWVKHTIRAKSFGRFYLSDEVQSVETQALRVDFHDRYSDDGFELTWEYKSKRDHAAVDELQEHSHRSTRFRASRVYAYIARH